MATSPAPASEAPAPISHIGRMFGALFNPQTAFEDIARRPSWIAPIALLAILGLGVAYGLNQRVDWESYIQQQAEKNPRFAQLSDEQKQQALGKQIQYAPVFAYALGALGAGLFAALLTLIYWGSFNLLAGAGLRFGNSFGIVSHAFMPSAIASVLAMITLYFKGHGEVDPEHLLASNVGALLASDAPRWLASLGSSLDLFWLWTLSLVGIGFGVSNPKKVTIGKGLGIVFGLWAVWVIAKVVWAAL